MAVEIQANDKNNKTITHTPNPPPKKTTKNLQMRSNQTQKLFHSKRNHKQNHQFSSVAQSCLTPCDPWTAAHQAFLSITNSWSLFKIMSMELVM